jgi:hypothetical protein
MVKKKIIHSLGPLIGLLLFAASSSTLPHSYREASKELLLNETILPEIMRLLP